MRTSANRIIQGAGRFTMMKVAIQPVFVLSAVSVLLMLSLVCSSAYAQRVHTVDYLNQADVLVYVAPYENQADLKVYRVQHQNQASINDGKWYYTNHPNQADKKIFFVDHPNQADLWIFFVRYPNQAGWRTNARKHMMY